MPDNTIQFGITVDASTVASGLARVQSAFQSATSSVAGQWAETGSTVALSLKKIVDEAETTSGRTKEEIEKAAGVVDLLGDLIGVKVPDQLQKMLASSRSVGPALEAAFSGIAIIAMGKLIFEVGQKIVTLISSLGDLSDAEKTYHDQVIKDANEELRFIQAQIKAAYAVQIAKASGNELAQQVLRVQMYTALVGASNQYVQKLEGEQQRLRNLAKTAHETSDDLIKSWSDQSGMAVIFSGKKAEGYEKEAAAQQRAIDEAKIAVQEATADQIAAAAQLGAEQKRERDEQQRRAQAVFRRAEQDFRQHLQTQLADLKQDHQVSLAEELYFWKARLAAARQYPDAYRQMINRIGDIERGLFRERRAAQDNFFRDAAAQAAASSNENLGAAKQSNKKIIKDLSDRLDAQAELYKADIDEAKVNEQIKVQLAEAALARGRISKQQEIQSVAAAKKEEIRLEMQAWQAIESLYDQEPKKVAEIEAKISKLKAQVRLADAKAVVDEAKATEATYKQLWTSIGNTFKSTFDGLIQGHETITQAVQKLLSGLLADIANYLEQKAIKEAAAFATSLIQKKADATAAIGADAGKAYSAAFADMASLGPAGLAAAPGAAAAAGSATLSGGMALAAMSLDVGTWKVPFDMPAMVHSGEMVVPRFESDLFRNAVRSGSEGTNITVVVNHSVNAIDAESFQGTIRKHGNMIGNEVARVLRRKGLSPA